CQLPDATYLPFQRSYRRYPSRKQRKKTAFHWPWLQSGPISPPGTHIAVPWLKGVGYGRRTSAGKQRGTGKEKEGFPQDAAHRPRRCGSGWRGRLLLLRERSGGGSLPE